MCKKILFLLGGENMSTAASVRQPNSARYRSPSPSHYRSRRASISPDERRIPVNVNSQSNAERRTCRSPCISPVASSSREIISPRYNLRSPSRSISPVQRIISGSISPQSDLERHSRSISPEERSGLINFRQLPHPMPINISSRPSTDQTHSSNNQRSSITKRN